jgi:exodeoxyribonuclease VII small subunit
MSSADEAATEVPVASLGYAQAAGELDTIIRELDQGVIDVDLLEARFRRAIDIVEELDQRIHGARARVDELLPRLEQIADAAAAAVDGP